MRLFLSRELYKLRCRLPLNFNDHAKTASRFGWAVLQHFQRSENLQAKDKYLNLFSSNFFMDISAHRLAGTLHMDPSCQDYLDHCKTDQCQLSVQSRVLLKRALKQLRHYPEVPDKTDILNTSGRPRLATLRPDFVPLRQVSEAQNASDQALLILGGPVEEKIDYSALKGFKSVSILPFTDIDLDRRISEIRSQLVSNADVKLLNVRVAQYSKEDQAISDFCDEIASTLIETKFSKHPAFLTLNPALYEPLSTHFSDALYRNIQRYFAIMKKLSTYPPGTTVFVESLQGDLSQSILREFPHRILALSYRNDPIRTVITKPEPLTRQKKPNDNIETIERLRLKLRKRVRKALRSVNFDRPNAVFIAVNSWDPSYKKALALIEQKLGHRFSLQILDIAAPTKVKDCLLYTSPSPRDA